MPGNVRPTLAALVTAEAAPAADCFLLHPNTASPGEPVTVTYGAAGSKTSPGRFELYLVPNEDADSVRAPDDPRLLPVGAIRIGTDGTGR